MTRIFYHKKIIALIANVMLFTFIVYSNPSRPQTPHPPYEYDTLDLKIENQVANIKLAGTLTYPTKDNAEIAIIMITGSGPQNRDEEILGHRPFKVIADFLSKNGMTVLRMDDRGCGDSEGDLDSDIDDFVTDINSAVSFFRNHTKYKKYKLGLLGHSEGGSVAIKSSSKADFIITMAAPAIKGDSALLSQVKALLDVSGQGAMWESTYSAAKRRYNWAMSDVSKDSLTNLLYDDVVKTIPSFMLTDATKATINTQIAAMTSKHFRTLLRYNPEEDIKNISVPWLALNGNKDLQVPSDVNLSNIRRLNSEATVIEFDGLNHLFQKCNTGMPQEYSMIEETISEEVLHKILEWINQTLK